MVPTPSACAFPCAHSKFARGGCCVALPLQLVLLYGREDVRCLGAAHDADPSDEEPDDSEASDLPWSLADLRFQTTLSSNNGLLASPFNKLANVRSAQTTRPMTRVLNNILRPLARQRVACWTRMSKKGIRRNIKMLRTRLVPGLNHTDQIGHATSSQICRGLKNKPKTCVKMLLYVFPCGMLDTREEVRRTRSSIDQILRRMWPRSLLENPLTCSRVALLDENLRDRWKFRPSNKRPQSQEVRRMSLDLSATNS